MLYLYLNEQGLCVHEKAESHSHNYSYFSKLEFVVKFIMEIAFKASLYTVTEYPI